MEALRVRAVTEEGRVVIEDASLHEGETVEVILLREPVARPTGTVGDLLDTAFGIWADRDDIGDGVEYARELRRQIEGNLRGR